MNIVIPFPARQSATRAFENVEGSLFREVSAYLQRSAAYLDGVGRVDEKELPVAKIVHYRTATMRLTTRQLDLASVMCTGLAWLEDAIGPHETLSRMDTLAVDPGDVWWDESLPPGFIALCRQYVGLARRVKAARERLVRLLEEEISAA